MAKVFIFTLYLFACTGIIQAQKIIGSVKNSRQQPVPGATVILHLFTDSSVVKINVADKNGNYIFSPVLPGNYFITTTNVGFSNGHTTTIFFNSNDIILAPVTIESKPERLTEVVMNVKRPMIEVKADKTIFNVEGSINAVGSDAMELLRKAPGVVVDRDDNIIMSGKNGVSVYIDGRPSPLSGTALSAYLRSLPSSSIDAIEIITNPSAKYDAAGNAGIINIKLKKNNIVGTNGTVNTGYSIGKYAKFVNGFSINNRSSHVNLFGNYNYNHATNETNLHVTRTQADTAFDQYSTGTNKIRDHTFKAGMDYFINRHNTLGLIVSGSADNNTMMLYSATPIIYAPTKFIDRWLVADNKNKTNNRNYNVNINYRHTDSTGCELSMDADYGYYKLRSDQLQPNYYYDASFTNIMTQRIYQMLAPSDIFIYSYKTDYEQNFKEGKLGIGGKLSYVNSQNYFDQFDIYTNSTLFDSARSNNFKYTENINAAYINYNKQYKNFQLQFGLRLENANITGRSMGFKMQGSNWQPYDSTFKRNYTDFFPSAAITFNKDPNNQFGFTYSRRIDRPAYQDLNPFEIKIDEYSYYKGNTELKPQYTNSVGITHSFHGNLNTRLSYSVVKDVFTRLVDTIELVKSFLIKKNVATQKILSLNINYNFQKDWYACFVNLNVFSSHYKADFGQGKTINLGVQSVTANMQQSAKLNKGWTIEMSCFYNSPSIWSGTFRSGSMFGMESGFQKKLFNEKANIKVAVSDIFHTMVWNGTSDFVGQHLVAEYRWESQLFKVNFSYHFGNTEVKAARQRRTIADEEGKRVNGGGEGLQN